ncbi:O-antigen ligase family protein [Paenibacillus sp. GYB004]|uniref:O-antigen ligase family protein n=1 Tax=Paenibacillus sp. GYB004 TaxID=2994393 RepID=UPI002F968794
MSQPVYGKSSKAAKQRQRNTEETSIFYWLTVFFVVAFLFFSSFQTALFNGESNQLFAVNSFESPIFSALLWSSFILIFIAIYFFSNWKLKDRTDLLSIGVWLIPLTYVISSFTAASDHLSTKMIFLQIMYSSFFVIGIYLNKNQLGNSILRNAIVICSYVIVLYGILNLFGNAYARDGIMLTDQGLRLTSVFQYANAYAAFLMAALFACLYLLVHSRKWYAIAGHSLMLVPIIVSFWLTLSRGGIVVIPFVLLLVLPFISLKKQFLFLGYLVIASLGSFAITDKMNAVGNDIVSRILATRTPDGKVSLLGLSDPKVLEGWTYLLIATVGVAAVTFLIHRFLGIRFLEKQVSWLSFKFSSFALPVLAVVVGLIGFYILTSDSPIRKMLPDTLEKRIENINFEQHSVLERTTFYKDAFKLIGDYPITGAGGGGWAALYEKYQNNPYTSRQAHNFFLQFWIEVGTLGIVILAAFLLYIMYQYIRSYITSNETSRRNTFIFYIIAISLLVHSVIDFEMSYAFIASLVFLCLGGMVSGFSTKELAFTNKSFFTKWRISYPIMLGVIAIVTFIYSATSMSANSRFAASLNNAAAQKPLQEIMNPLNGALDLKATHPDYVLTKVGFLIQLYSQNKDENIFNEAVTLIQAARTKEPHNKSIYGQEYQLYSLKNDQDKLLELATEGLEKYPWDTSLYDSFATMHLQRSQSARAGNNKALADQHADKVIGAYQTVIQKIEHLKTLPDAQMQGAAFDLSVTLISAAGQAYYGKGDYNAAAETLKGSIGGNIDDANIQTIIRWYLASVMKQGKSDQELYNKLVAKNPNEKNEIEKLLQMQ